MARPIREKSGTGVYHVMLRGINRQDIFEDEEDYLTDHGVGSTDHSELLKTLAAGTKEIVEELNDELYPQEFSKGSRVLHKVFGKGKILEKMENGSYKVHFEIGDRFVQSSFLVLSESSRAESRITVSDKKMDEQVKQMKEERAKRLAVKEGDMIYNSEYGKGIVLRIVEKGRMRKMIVKFNRYRKEKEMSPSWDKFKILNS